MEFIINLFKKEQDKNGYLSEDFLKKTSKKHNIPIVKLWGAATFYFLLQTEKKGKYIIHICNSPSCYVNGSLDIIRYLEKKLKVKLDQTTKNKKFSLYSSSCIGCCDRAPAMLVNGRLFDKLTKEKIDIILKTLK